MLKQYDVTNNSLILINLHYPKANYNPASKFDAIYDRMVFNCNAITKYADENQTVDETTWGHAGYGESGSGITTRLMNKKVNKGGQTTIMSDSKRFRPLAYIHRHKLHKSIDSMTRRGPNKLCNLLTDISAMILPQDPLNTTTSRAYLLFNQPTVPTSKEGAKKIFRRKPVVCVDNFFMMTRCVSGLVRIALAV